METNETYEYYQNNTPEFKETDWSLTKQLARTLTIGAIIKTSTKDNYKENESYIKLSNEEKYIVDDYFKNGFKPQCF